MRPSIDIDYKHSRAIVQEVGERLRSILREEQELPKPIRALMARLREQEEMES
ncbi:hypothetical protein [Bradyrhizobium sp. LTSPM299]|jgi:hypothetical protein|uniref:hypothetical protein n=1 Tax=Bradyrhizobium sp. LTSPM299 TaxID=1619233 RepID=UPI000B1911DE|nr:hypothetical protein [Bradyrhizobium sp. LTSPM299]